MSVWLRKCIDEPNPFITVTPISGCEQNTGLGLTMVFANKCSATLNSTSPVGLMFMSSSIVIRLKDASAFKFLRHSSKTQHRITTVIKPSIFGRRRQERDRFPTLQFGFDSTLVESRWKTWNDTGYDVHNMPSAYKPSCHNSIERFRVTVVSGILQGPDVEERRTNPVQSHAHVRDGVKDDLGVQMLYQVCVQASDRFRRYWIGR